jgi:hypothetical protein
MKKTIKWGAYLFFGQSIEAMHFIAFNMQHKTIRTLWKYRKTKPPP